MQVAALRSLALTGLLALALAGCPNRRPPEVEPTVAPPITPVLVRSFADLGPDQYAELRTDPPREALGLEAVTARHDTGRWTSIRTVWGTLPVIEFRDTDHPNSGLQPTAGWYLGPARRDGGETVGVALVRDFADAPEAADPDELVLGLGERWPLPWTLCRLADRRQLAHDPLRGVVLSLRSTADGEGSARWTVEHVEYLALGLPLASWLETKGHGACEELGTWIEGGKFRPARRSGE